MQVSYRKVGNRWHIRFRKGSGKERREITESFPGNIHESTIRKKADWYDIEISMGNYDPFEKNNHSSGVTLGDALHDYCEENLHSGNWAPDSTYKTNVNVFKRMFEGSADKPIQRFNNDFFQNKLQNSAGNARTKKGNAGRVNTFLKWAHKKGFLPEQYSVKITMHDVVDLRNKESIKYITWNQLRDVCDAHRWLHRQNKAIYKQQSGKEPDFYTDMWWFMFYSLLRKEEVPKLKVKDYNKGRLKVRGKGRRTDSIILPPPAQTIAEKYAMGKQPDDHLFVSHMNRPEVHLSNAVNLALGQNHHSKGFHQLRHGGVVHYITLGKPVQFVSKLARHRSIQVTLTVYADIIDEGMEEAFRDISHAPATPQKITDQRTHTLN